MSKKQPRKQDAHGCTVKLPWLGASNHMQAAITKADPRAVPLTSINDNELFDCLRILNSRQQPKRNTINVRNLQLWAATMAMYAYMRQTQIPALQKLCDEHEGTPRAAVYQDAVTVTGNAVTLWGAEMVHLMATGKTYNKVQSDADAIDLYRRQLLGYTMLQGALYQQMTSAALAGVAGMRDGNARGGAARLSERIRQSRFVLAVHLYGEIAAKNPNLTRSTIMRRVSERMKQEARRNPEAPFVSCRDYPERGLSLTSIKSLLKDLD